MKDDTISRQAALDALGEEPLVWHDGEGEIAEREQWRHDVAAIKALPSAHSERKQGNWIFQGNRSKTLYGWYFCSECGAYIGGKCNFCSECGADMREVQDV